MQSEQEVKELKEELSKLTGFISEFGSTPEFQNKDVRFSCDVCDVLSWVLKEISTEHFKSDSYINLDKLKHIARAIEVKTGKKLNDYE